MKAFWKWEARPYTSARNMSARPLRSPGPVMLLGSGHRAGLRSPDQSEKEHLKYRGPFSGFPVCSIWFLLLDCLLCSRSFCFYDMLSPFAIYVRLTPWFQCSVSLKVYPCSYCDTVSAWKILHRNRWNALQTEKTESGAMSTITSQAPSYLLVLTNLGE